MPRWGSREASAGVVRQAKPVVNAGFCIFASRVVPWGNLYISDTDNQRVRNDFHHRVRKVSPDGRIATAAGTGVAGTAAMAGRPRWRNSPIPPALPWIVPAHSTSRTRITNLRRHGSGQDLSGVQTYTFEEMKAAVDAAHVARGSGSPFIHVAPRVCVMPSAPAPIFWNILPAWTMRRLPKWRGARPFARARGLPWGRTRSTRRSVRIRASSARRQGLDDTGAAVAGRNRRRR